MTRGNSPYYIRETIEIGKTGSLNIESGVIINFHPGAGILVKGALIAKVKLGLVILFCNFHEFLNIRKGVKRLHSSFYDF